MFQLPFAVLFGAVGLVWGYTIQQFSQTVYILGAGMLLASLLTIPPWGIYRCSTPDSTHPWGRACC
jgi:hypothetical protein